jgi:hypothetical protein
LPSLQTSPYHALAAGGRSRGVPITDTVLDVEAAERLAAVLKVASRANPAAAGAADRGSSRTRRFPLAVGDIAADYAQQASSSHHESRTGTVQDQPHVLLSLLQCNG